MIKFLESLSKSKRPSCKSYSHLTNAVSDVMITPKLQFFCFLSGIMQLLLTKYQSDKTMISYLYSVILKLIKNLMQFIVKPDLLEKCESYLDFRRIDVDDKESITKPKDMNIGCAARFSIQESRKNDEIRNLDVAAFCQNQQSLLSPF